MSTITNTAVRSNFVSTSDTMLMKWLQYFNRSTLRMWIVHTKHYKENAKVGMAQRKLTTASKKNRQWASRKSKLFDFWLFLDSNGICHKKFLPQGQNPIRHFWCKVAMKTSCSDQAVTCFFSKISNLYKWYHGTSRWKT